MIDYVRLATLIISALAAWVWSLVSHRERGWRKLYAIPVILMALSEVAFLTIRLWFYPELVSVQQLNNISYAMRLQGVTTCLLLGWFIYNDIKYRGQHHGN